MDTQTADGIMLLNLRQYRKLLKRDILDFQAGVGYHHPDDIDHTMLVMASIDVILDEFEVNL